MATKEEVLQYLSFLSADEKAIITSALDRPPVAAIKINTGKISSEEIKQYFPHLQEHPLFKDIFIYDKKEYQLGRHPFFDAGVFYIQEPSSACVVPLADIKSDDKVLDLCAAPGGKSVAVASLLKEGLLVSNDVNFQRAKVLQENIEKWGLSNCIVTCQEVKNLTTIFANYFDKIILDVPCSLLGTIRKDSEALSLWSPSKVKSLQSVQKYLLSQAILMLKAGGQIIYSTCTYTLEENEDVINYAVNELGLSLQSLPESPYFRRGINQPETIRLYPEIAPGEGHFIAKLIKSEGGYQDKKFLKSTISPIAWKIFYDFMQDTLHIHFKKEFIFQFGDNLYYNEQPIELKSNILLYGLYLGRVGNNYFVPSHHLALFLKKEQAKQTLTLSLQSKELSSFLKGESLENLSFKGYVLIFVDQFPLGWGKASNAIIKNHFLKK